MPISEVFNEDCRKGMKKYPDKYFDLAIIDPEYGINVNHNMGRRKGDKASTYKPATWDKKSIDSKTIKEIFRVSKNQIIWGANHFISKISIDSPCWLLWDKGFSEEVTFAQFELAWTSFKSTCKKFDKSSADKTRIHPTQKPALLYNWLLNMYGKKGDKILDTHLGSQSSRIAAYKLGFDFWGWEIDKDYFDEGNKRFEKEIAEPLFAQPKKYIQTSII